jgi:hypothetical protein
LGIGDCHQPSARSQESGKRRMAKEERKKGKGEERSQKIITGVNCV